MTTKEQNILWESKPNNSRNYQRLYNLEVQYRAPDQFI
jgi:hypothetical protein